MIKKMLIRGVVSGLLLKSLSMVVFLLSTPFFIKYFGTADYGLLVAITALSSILSLLHLGIPSAVSVIGMQMAAGSKVNRLFNKLFSAYVVYTAAVLALMIFVGYLYPGLLEKLLKTKLSLPVTFLGMLFVCSNSVASLMQATYTALHKVHYANLQAGISSILPLLSLYLTMRHAESIVFYFQCLAGSNVALSIISMAYYNYIRKDDKTVALSDGDIVRMSNKNIAVTAITATTITIVSLVLNQFDTIVVSYNLTKENIVQYSILNKIIIIESLGYGLVFSSVLPLLANWFADKKFYLIEESHRRLQILMSVLGGASIIGNVLFLEIFISAWVGSAGYAGFLSVLMYSLFSYISAIYSVNYVIYSSFNTGRKLMILAAMMESIVKVTLTICLTRTLGLNGTVLSCVLHAGFVTFPLTLWFLKKLSSGKIRISYQFATKHMLVIILPFTCISSAMGENGGILARILVLSAYLFASWLLIAPKDRSFVIDNHP